MLAQAEPGADAAGGIVATLSRPDGPQMTRAGDEGGYRLVAAVSGPEDALVAEAGYAILPDGDGEFALRAWQ